MMRRLRARTERGTVSAFVVGITVALLACAGLVADGGNALNARMKLADDVEQAARAGAAEIDLDELHDRGVLKVDQDRARARVYAFLAGSGYTVTSITFPGDDSVSVTATDVVETQLLGLVGVDKFDVRASATAEGTTR